MSTVSLIAGESRSSPVTRPFQAHENGSHVVAESRRRNHRAARHSVRLPFDEGRRPRSSAGRSVSVLVRQFRPCPSLDDPSEQQYDSRDDHERDQFPTHCGRFEYRDCHRYTPARGVSRRSRRVHREQQRPAGRRDRSLRPDDLVAGGARREHRRPVPVPVADQMATSWERPPAPRARAERVGAGSCRCHGRTRSGTCFVS